MTKYKRWFWLGPKIDISPCGSEKGCKRNHKMICPGKIKGDCVFYRGGIDSGYDYAASRLIMVVVNKDVKT
jgi:hypothetical protein